jgi:hypothetical protein
MVETLINYNDELALMRYWPEEKRIKVKIIGIEEVVCSPELSGKINTKIKILSWHCWFVRQNSIFYPIVIVDQFV